MNPLHAVVYAKDLERVAAFYAGVLAAATVARRDGDFVTLGSDEWELSIVAIPEAIASSIAIAVPPVRREATAVKVSFGVADLAVARTAAAELGGVLDERAWTWRDAVHCDGHDPEGNVFQLRAPARPADP